VFQRIPVHFADSAQINFAPQQSRFATGCSFLKSQKKSFHGRLEKSQFFN
jgi:hypothetical protein